MTRATVVALAALVVGCGGSGSTGVGGGTGGSGGTGGAGGGSAGISADQACTNYATAYCNKLNGCFPFATTAFYGDVATCIARGKLICLPQLALSTTGSTPSKWDACVPMLSTASCAAVRAGKAGCRFSGMLAAGSACGSGSQCAGGYCRLSTNSCGVCASRVANGNNCTTSDDCLDGKCLNAICVARRQAGAACATTTQCDDLLYCKNSVCTAVLTTAGAACDPNDSDSCDYLSGVFCNNSNVCARIQFAGPGAACGVMANDSYVECSSGATCKTNGAIFGTCVGAAADGQACNPTNDLNCVDPAACESGSCRLYSPGSCK